MIRTKLLLFTLCCLVLPQYSIAQTIHYTPFYTTPTTLNPAFTGMFDGNLRAGVIYRNQWASVTVPFVTLGLSADMPVLAFKDGSYIAAGVQAMKDQAGDANLDNFFAAGSASYHRQFSRGNWLRLHPLDIGIGMQVGFSQRTINLSSLYFNSAQATDPVPQGVALGIPHDERTSPVSIGLSLSQSMSRQFSYTLGYSVNNAIESSDIKASRRSALGLDRYYSIVAGATWQPTRRIILSPAFMYIDYKTREQWIGGTELAYIISHETATFDRFALFAAAWYRNVDNVTLTAGVEYMRIKLTLSFNGPTNSNSSSNGDGAFEISLRYTAPALGLKAKRNVPCNRF